MELPAWLAAIVHVPAVTPVTIFPLTVHTLEVVLENVTARLAVAVALTVIFPPTSINVGVKLIVPILWLFLAIVIIFVICGAAL